MTAATQAPTAGQAAAASPGVSAPGSFLTAGPMDGRPGLGAPGRGLVPSAVAVRVGSPAPDPVATVDLGIERNVRDGIGRMRDARIQPLAFPVEPWRAADGGGGEHDQSIPPGQGVDQHQRLGGECIASPLHAGVSK
jgi:hypothetical protein